MKIIKLILSLVPTIGLVIALNTKIGFAPPIGKFLDPFNGFWQNAERPLAGHVNSYAENIDLSGLQDEVKVYYDEEMVPHIFAQNDEDLYFMQGYVTAQHRLWQMEFQTHAAAGRISEIVGEVALGLDRQNRRKGLGVAAREAYKAAEADPGMLKITHAYANGINAYISSLKYADYPLEYKLLDYAPEKWGAAKSFYLLSYMSDMLSYSNADLEYTNALKLFGKEYFDVLYPDTHSEQDPIVNMATEWDFEPLAIQLPGDGAFCDELIDNSLMEMPPKGIGSNNWAVSGKKTASGHPILCGDPHLGLNLPSIWFVMHHHAPGVNTMGGTLPGSPMVIIGFNDSTAWSETNSPRDVVDWYSIEFQDSTKSAYKLDGEWMSTEKKIEEIKIRGQEIFYDTVIYTHWGPVVYDDSFMPGSEKKYFAQHWVSLLPSEELKTFYLLNRGHNYQDYRQALNYYDSPAQNFAFASAAGDVAIVSQGKFPVKWPNQGKFLMDGSKLSNQWQGFIPSEQNVFSLNPERGFISSANQHPVDSTYPYYVFAHQYEFYRNRRINFLLDSMEKITIDDMKRVQNDNYNLMAAEALPIMLQLLDKEGLDGDALAYCQTLKTWDFVNDGDIPAPAYFQEWWRQLFYMTWDEVRNAGVEITYPSDFTTIKLLKEHPEFDFFDVKSTSHKESAKDVVNKAFHQAVDAIGKKSQEEGREIDWATYKNTKLSHLAKVIEPFNIPGIKNGGSSNSINATTGNWGPSWRLIVELKPEGPEAYGVYPGGQSGNPGSHFYGNYVERWEKGEYFPLLFSAEQEKIAEKAIVAQTFKAK